MCLLCAYYVQAPSEMAGAGTGLHARGALDVGTVVCLHPVARVSLP